MGELMIERHYRAWAVLLLVFLCGALITLATIFASSNIPTNVGRELVGAEKEEVVARNSPLTSYVYLSPNAYFPREQPIKKITIHHMASNNFSLEELGETFAQRDRKASSNYAIDKEGNVALYVEESNGSWASSSKENDEQAVTIEVENSEMGGEWPISKESYEALIVLCADICQRNGIDELVFTGDATGNLTYHHMFNEDTSCPGPYLMNHMSQIADDVNSKLRYQLPDGA